MNLFRKKDIAHLAQDAEKSGFVRNLTAFDLVFLGIGSVIGTGIFVLTGVGAALYAGPGIAISFILASVACAFAGGLRGIFFNGTSIWKCICLYIRFIR